MKIDIIISGVGGQGILSIATVLGIGALKSDLFIKQSEVHGMSQRGGSVQSHLRISDHEIASDLIPRGEADLILSVEPMESLRYLPYLNWNGWIVSNIEPFLNIPSYPDISIIINEIKKQKNHIIIDADNIARELGSVRSSNIVTLGAASNVINLPRENIISGIEKIFENKGKSVVDMNIHAFFAGEKEGKRYCNKSK